MRCLDDTLHDMSRNDLGFLSDAQPVGTAERAERDAAALAAPSATALDPRTRGVIIATAVWSLCELPFEIWVSRTLWKSAACILAKLRGSRWWVSCWPAAGSRVSPMAFFARSD